MNPRHQPITYHLARALASLAGRAPVMMLALLMLGMVAAAMQAREVRFSEPLVLNGTLHSPASTVYQTLQRHFNANEFVMVVLEARRAEQEFQLKALAEVVARSVRDPRFVADVAYRADHLTVIYPYQEDVFEPGTGRRTIDGLLVNYLTAEDWAAMRHRLDPGELQRATASLRARLAGFGQARVPPLDPLGIFLPMRERMQASMIPLTTGTRDGYFLSADRRMLVMFLQPVSSAADLSFSLALDDFLRETFEAIQEDRDLLRDVTLHALGPQIEVAAEATMIRRDVQQALGIGAVLGTALLLIAYRRAFVLVSVGLPMGAVLMLGVGALAWWGQALSFASITALSVLITLAALIAVNLHDRYIEEARARPDALREALLHSAGATGRATLVPTLFASLLGATLLWAELVDARTFGMALAIGAPVVWVVALLAATAAVGAMAVPSRRRSLSEHFSTLGIRHVAWGALAFPRAWSSMVVMATAYLALQLAFLQFHDEPSTFGTLPESYRASQDRVATRFDLPVAQLQLVLRDADLERLLQQVEALYAALRQARNEYDISAIVSLRNLLPSMESQRASREAILAINRVLLERALEEAATEQQLNASVIFAPFLRTIDTLRTFATHQPYVRWGDLRDPRVMQAVRMHLAHDGRDYVALTSIYSAAERWRTGMPERLKADLMRQFPTMSYTSPADLEREKIRFVQSQFVRASVVAALLLGVLAMLALGSARWAALAFAPPLLLSVWLLGSVPPAGQSLNVGMLMMLPAALLLSIGSALIFMSRLRDFREGSPPGTPMLEPVYFTVDFSGRAIAVVHLLALLTGAALLLGEHPGLRTIGTMAMLAAIYSMVLVLAVLPCLVVLLGQRRARPLTAQDFFDDPRPLYDLQSRLEAQPANRDA